MPNSAARFRFGMAGVSPWFAAVLGLIKLAPRGGRGLERSGPEGFLPLSAAEGRLTEVSFDGLRILISGSDGLRSGEYELALGIGNVCDRSSARRNSLRSSLTGGGPNPSYPFFLGRRGRLPL